MNIHIDPKVVREMVAKMGRNLLRFQQIELGLKVVLPLTHLQRTGDDTYAILKEEVRLLTLGGLRTRLLEAVSTDDPEAFSNYLAAVVESRNGFIHHFQEQPGVSLTSEPGYRAAISYLDKQYEFTHALFTLVIGLSAELSALLVERDALDGL